MSTELNLDKDNWKTVKLGEVAEELSIRVENPEESKFDKFVGLENFVSGDLKIKTYETTQGLVSAAKQFQSGDILFARRNAYLRRASLVEFNGICSGDAFVLRENSDHVLPGFLAFVANSDRLWNYANTNAAGTMSKRVKWRDLANYEFLLPPKEQQAKIAELLWAMDKVVQNEKMLLRQSKILFKKMLEDFLIGIIPNQTKTLEKKKGFLPSKLPWLPENWSYEKVEDYIWFQEGPGVRNTQFRDTGVKLLNGTNINNNNLDLSTTNRFIAEEEAYGAYEHFLCEAGDLIIACSGIAVDKFNEKIAYVKHHHLPLCMNTSTMRFREKGNSVIIDFFRYFLMSNLFKFQIRRLITGSAQLNFGPSHMSEIYLPVLPKKDQEFIVLQLNEVSQVKSKIESKIENSLAVQKSLINQVL